VEYKPFDPATGKSASTVPGTYSETETVSAVQNLSEKVTVSTSGTVKHAGTKFKFQVSPVAGVGTIRVTISRSGSKTLTYNIAIDSEGAASTTLKLGAKLGAYKVSARFLGNTWGVGSKTAVKNIRANH
jgi:hypothetical protein